MASKKSLWKSEGFYKMKNKTINFYNKNAKEWTKGHVLKKGSYRDKVTIKFGKLLSGGKILEVGSGSGEDAEKLVELGFDYIGIDGSEEFVKLAKKLHPNINFLTMAVEKLNFPKNTFDGFYTSATLLHIPKKKISMVLQKIKNVCKTGAIGFITLKEGAGEIREKETDRWFSFYKKGEFEKILKENGFEIIEFEIEKDWREGKPDWLFFWIKKI